MSVARIAAAGILAYGAYLIYTGSQDSAQAVEDTAPDESTDETWLSSADDILTTAVEPVAEVIDNLTGGILQVSAMARVNPLDLNNRNVQAILRVIRRGEGTADDMGYRRMFGGKLFDSYADHPRIVVKSSGYTSSAAGAYQFIITSWDETKRIMKLTDFTPRSQDLAALGRIVARGALADVKEGRFDMAVKKIAREWASLPGSPYGQPTISWDTARQVFASAGGDLNAATA